MRRTADPLALDPLGPMDIGPGTDHYAPYDPLALDPLSPIGVGAGRLNADDSETTGK